MQWCVWRQVWTTHGRKQPQGWTKKEQLMEQKAHWMHRRGCQWGRKGNNNCGSYQCSCKKNWWKCLAANMIQKSNIWFFSGHRNLLGGQQLMSSHLGGRQPGLAQRMRNPMLWVSRSISRGLQIVIVGHIKRQASRNAPGHSEHRIPHPLSQTRLPTAAKSNSQEIVWAWAVGWADRTSRVNLQANFCGEGRVGKRQWRTMDSRTYRSMWGKQQEQHKRQCGKQTTNKKKIKLIASGWCRL